MTQEKLYPISGLSNPLSQSLNLITGRITRLKTPQDIMKANALAYCASFIALAFGSCTQTSKNESASDMPRSVPVAHVTVLDTTIYNEYVADIQAVKNVEVRARLSGFLE